MNKIFYSLIATVAVTATSCSGTYDIKGTSDVSMLDGKMLYLKAYKNSDLKNIDSCDVVHGQFSFNGQLDSTKMVTLFLDDESLMPVVLEHGDISIKIDNGQQKVSGTPLNDKLSGFLEKYNQLDMQMEELGHKQSQAIMNGEDENVTNARLSQEAQNIAEREDKLITSFITENFDNVLGPGVFFMMTAGNKYPELSPWIEEIMSKATDKFKNDPYVRDYYRKAQDNQNIMNGMATPDQPAPPMPDAAPQDGAPTPNDLAQPAE
ncbi:MAG TPA: hypothetical protein DEQ27_05280 [Prevotella sp.]|nr:hypothetical protein [Prevotella sp.]